MDDDEDGESKEKAIRWWTGLLLRVHPGDKDISWARARDEAPGAAATLQQQRERELDQSIWW